MPYIENVKTGANRNKYGFFLLSGTTVSGFIVFITNLLRSNMVHDTDWLSWVYYIPSALGHASLFAVVLLLIFYLPFLFLFRNCKVPVIVYTVFAVILQTLLILDSFVFDLYRFHINGFVVELILGGAGGDNFVFDFSLYLKFGLLIIFTAIIPCLLIAYLGKRYSHLLRKKQMVLIGVLLMICVFVSHMGHAVAAAIQQTGIQKSATALPYFFPLTANRVLENIGIVNNDEIDNLRYNIPSADIEYPLRPIVTGDSIPGYNVILIAIDSWNPRSFDSITTPNMYRWAQQGHCFDHHLSSSNGTRGSLFGLFFGVSFTYEKEFIITKKLPVLVDQFVDRGYAVQTFPSTVFSTPPFHKIFFGRVPGINTKTPGATPFERDNKITEMAIEDMNRQKPGKPFFSFIFYDLPHAMSMPKEYLDKFQPSWTKADYMALNNNTDPKPFFNLYRNCVYQVDRQVGMLLDNIRKNGLPDNTVIIITGDHSQEFNENRKNYWGHNSNYSKWQINVPMIVYYPGIEAGKRFSHVTTHYDVAPTLMKRFLAVENPPADYCMGYDIYDITNRYPHVVGDHVNYGFVFENAVMSTNHLGRMMVFDKDMNSISCKAINVTDLQKVVEKKNMFYKMGKYAQE